MRIHRRLALLLGMLFSIAVFASASIAQHMGAPDFGRTPGTPLGPSSDPVPGAPSTGMSPEGPVVTPGIGRGPGPGLTFSAPPSARDPRNTDMGDNTGSKTGKPSGRSGAGEMAEPESDPGSARTGAGSEHGSDKAEQR